MMVLFLDLLSSLIVICMYLAMGIIFLMVTEPIRLPDKNIFHDVLTVLFWPVLLFRLVTGK